MLAMNPHFGTGNCMEWDDRNGWTTMGILIGTTQNAARFIFLSMQICVLTSFRQTSSQGNSRGIIMLAASLALGFVPSLLVYPNTVREICMTAAVDQPLSESSVAYNLAYSLILLVVTGALTVATFHRRTQAGLHGKAQKSSGVKSAYRFLELEFILLYFMQVINSLRVLLGSAVMGAFAQMLVVENILEHGQLIFLLFIAVNDKEFSVLLGETLPGFGRGDCPVSVYPDQVFATHSIADGSPLASADGASDDDSDVPFDRRGDESDDSSEASSLE